MNLSSLIKQMLEKLQARILRGSKNKLFEILLEKEFWGDLGTVMAFCNIPQVDRTPTQNNVLDLYKNLYHPNGLCPSKLYKEISPRLQERYDFVHDLICSFLYD